MSPTSSSEPSPPGHADRRAELARNLTEVRARIDAACAAAGRDSALLAAALVVGRVLRTRHALTGDHWLAPGTRIELSGGASTVDFRMAPELGMVAFSYCPRSILSCPRCT